MGGVLFLILTLVLVVILAWVHWGTGMCFLNNGAGFVPRVPDASAWDALSEAAKLVSNVNQTAYGFGYSGCRLETAHRFLPDQGGWWYYWRLPISTPTTRTFVWARGDAPISAWWTQYARSRPATARPAPLIGVNSSRSMGCSPPPPSPDPPRPPPRIPASGASERRPPLPGHARCDDVTPMSSQASVILLMICVGVQGAEPRHVV